MLRKFTLCAALTWTISCSASILPPHKKGPSDTEWILIILALTPRSGPCSAVASPDLASAQPVGLMVGAGNITGRLVTASGQNAVSQLVIAEDTANPGVNFWSSHTSVNRNGTFEIAGIPSGTTVRLSFEPIASMYYYRIDSQIDCFMTPASFSPGWASTNGSSITPGKTSGATYLITSGTTIDVGTISLD